MGDVERVLYSSEGRIMKAIICDDEKVHVLNWKK